MMTPTFLRTSARVDPIGIDRVPEFTWRSPADDRAEEPRSARVRVLSSEGAEVWDSGDVILDGVPAMSYGGPDLPSRSAFSWQVRVTGVDGAASPWSEAAVFETGLRGEGLEPATWIRLDEQHEIGETAPVQYFRRELELRAAPVRARAYSTALGWYRLGVNGVDVSGEGIFPGFTAFESRVEYQARDITAQLRRGANTLSIMLADGRYRGRIGALGAPAIYGNRTAVIARIEVELEDGSVVVVGTDASWAGGHGAIGLADPRAGEVIDARRFGDGDRVGDAIVEGIPVIEVAESRHLVEETAAPLLAGPALGEIGRHTAPSGALVVDFGQNAHGVARLTLRGRAGAEVVVHHSEVLDPEGEVDLDYLFGGMPIDSHLRPNRYILSGGDDVFLPTFSTQGFRFVSLSSADSFELVHAESVPLFASFSYDGRFSSSNPLVDQFHANVAWSMRGNFLDVPTDCPTRERSGWTGDAQVFAPTALLMSDSADYFRNWLTDMRLQQHSDGTIPDIVPVDADAWREGGASGELLPGVALPPPGSAGWGDAIVLIPWALYQATGSTRALQENYDAMTRWIARYAVLAAGGADPEDRFFVDSGYHWGEWLEPAGEGDGTYDVGGLIADLTETPRAWVATAYFEHSSRILSEIAELLGKDADAAHFRQYADGARAAWQHHYQLADGSLAPEAQATYVRALQFGLVDDSRRGETVARLVKRIRDRGTHLGTGFLSTGFLLETLSAEGADDVALDLLLQESAPSWLGQVRAGATTIWETWTGDDGNGRAMMSHNHYSLGASARWLYERLAGIRAASPGWRRITIDPLINRRIPDVSASTGTPFGDVAIAWRLEADRVTADLVVPPGASATLRARGARDVVVDGSTAEGQRQDGGLVIELRSGRHRAEWAVDEQSIVS